MALSMSSPTMYLLVVLGTLAQCDAAYLLGASQNLRHGAGHALGVVTNEVHNGDPIAAETFLAAAKTKQDEPVNGNASHELWGKQSNTITPINGSEDWWCPCSWNAHMHSCGSGTSWFSKTTACCCDAGFTFDFKSEQCTNVEENEPDVGAPEANESNVEDAEPKANETTANETVTNESKEASTAEPKAEEPKAEEPKTEEPKADMTTAKKSKAEESKGEETTATESKAEETKGEDAKAKESKAERSTEETTEERKVDGSEASAPTDMDAKAEMATDSGKAEEAGSPSEAPKVDEVAATLIHTSKPHVPFVTESSDTIQGSESWWSCWHEGMHKCGEKCCCDAALSWDASTETCSKMKSLPDQDDVEKADAGDNASVKASPPVNEASPPATETPPPAIEKPTAANASNETAGNVSDENTSAEATTTGDSNNTVPNQSTATPTAEAVEAPEPIVGSEKWWFCWHRHMHPCEGRCCCDVGFIYAVHLEECVEAVTPEVHDPEPSGETTPEVAQEVAPDAVAENTPSAPAKKKAQAPTRSYDDDAYSAEWHGEWKQGRYPTYKETMSKTTTFAAKRQHA
mmetsp:Transcript_96568/g.272987  ORF Transcript_96568/g.272987 Transcript_96568/m.272987 type:complete len:576 (+) Transcript_96568:92-1819(+)